ncbi:YceI family protein [Gammaproteobacteria bacterium]|nr:YceI family protein [Gammaproteobacteria bacterium]
MRSKLINTALCLALSLCASSLQAADAENYTLTRQYGSVMFKVLHQQYLNMVGRFDNYSGTLYLDPDDVSNSRLDATVQMGSLNMADSDVVETLVNSSSWFNAALYPEASFTTTAVTSFSRADFGMNDYSGFIGDEITLEINGEFQRD